MNKNIVCIIQARTTSTRLPNKIFLDLEGEAVLARVIQRLKKSKLINKIVIASPNSSSNDAIEEFVLKNFPEVGSFRGSEDDVLDRYYGAAKKFKADIVIRITSDCPLIDAEVVDKVIEKLLESKADYAANVLGERTYPRGMDTEVFSFATLEKMWRQAEDKSEREHVTLYLHRHKEEFSTANVKNDEDYSNYRLTLDEEDDYKLIKEIYRELFSANNDFGLDDIINLLKRKPELTAINEHVEQKKS